MRYLVLSAHLDHAERTFTFGTVAVNLGMASLGVTFPERRMRYIAAYVLAVMGGNSSPTEEDIRAIISSVGIDIDEFKLKKVISELQGKEIEDLIALGNSRLATSAVGGGGNVTVSIQDNIEVEKKDDEKPAEAADDGESTDEDMIMGLFGDSD